MQIPALNSQKRPVFVSETAFYRSPFKRGYVGAVLYVRTKLSVVVLLSFVMGVLPAVASAHAKSVSYSNWRFGDAEVHVSVRVPLLELTRLGIPLPVTGGRADTAALEGVGRYLADHLRGGTPGGACRPTESRSSSRASALPRPRSGVGARIAR